MRAARDAANLGDMSSNLLCLPGGLGTAAFFDDIAAAPALAAGGVRAVAATLPGFGGVPFPAGFDPTLEAYAAFAGELAREHDCTAVAGHSFGANIALEMAALGHFSGPLILLSPTFSAEDEVKGLATFNRIGYVPGLRSLVTALMFRSFPKMLRGAVPDHRVEALAAEMATNDRVDIRIHLRRYYDYLHRYGTLAPRLCESGVQAEVVFGEHDEVGLTPAERSTLESCPTTRLHYAPDAGHMLINQQPDWIAELIVDAVARYGDQTRQDVRSRTARSTLR
ncbi:MAG TPA: alpha/beta hydrolase [Gaiellaceae bacterium]|jgi:pimeloyl-ACP methyl ester carboxylesterase|nr:alpha/beta hydrolase [Gaiellaceae bacterium]